MRISMNVDLTPEEARAFLGLPNVEPINDMMVERVREQMQNNMDMMDPKTLMDTWMALGGKMRDQFFTVMTGAATAAAGQDDPDSKR